MARNTIQKGKLIEFNYKIVDPDGNIVEQTNKPISQIYKTGQGMYPIIEDALENHEEGDVVTVVLSPEQGFGEYDPTLFFDDNIANVPEQFHKVGAEVNMQGSDGEPRTFYVHKIEDDKITFDGNNPLAGKTLNFIITIVTVRDPSKKESDAFEELQNEMKKELSELSSDDVELLYNKGTLH